MGNAKFNIIIMTYNRHDMLKLCLESFKKQTFNDFELIVVDRGSEPSAENIVKEINDTRFSYIQSSQDIHFCDIGNEVIKKYVKGKYLCVFGDDDLIHKKALELVNNAFDKYIDCDIVNIGSVSLKVKFPERIFIPSDFSSYKDFPYFKEDCKTLKFSGKEYLKYIMSAQFIGPETEIKFPSYIHPSTFFLRMDVNYQKTIEKQKGIMVKPSFDSGYLGLAYRTNIVYLNAPLCVIRRGDNVTVASRRTWLEETKDVEYMPKIAQLENRGADSLLRVLHLNNIEREFDTKISFKLYRKILKELQKDPIWDRLTLRDYLILFPYMISSSKRKIDAFCEYMSSVIRGTRYHQLGLVKEPEINARNYLTMQDVYEMIDFKYKKQISLVNKELLQNK